MNGVYLQLHAYMLRIAIPYGTLSSDQMRMLAHVARRYDRSYGHFTTRQNIQFNWIKLDELPDAHGRSRACGMHACRPAATACATSPPTSGPASRRTRSRTRASGRKSAPALDAASGILVPAAQVQDRGHRRAHDRAAVAVHDIGCGCIATARARSASR
jgi:sulfite reductase (NADPH) hemoprotein beta-component